MEINGGRCRLLSRYPPHEIPLCAVTANARRCAGVPCWKLREITESASKNKTKTKVSRERGPVQISRAATSRNHLVV